MKRIVLLLWGCLAWLLPTSAADASLPDSLLTERYIQRLQVTYPHRALELLDEAGRRDLPQFPRYRQLSLRSTCYGTLGDAARREEYARLALADDSVRLVPSRRLKVLTQVADALQQGDKYEECIRVSREVLDLARELGNLTAQTQTLVKMGTVFLLLKRPDEALDSYRRCIALLEKEEDVRALAQLSLAYGELATALLSNHQPEEAVEVCLKRKEVVERMSTMPGPPPGYIDQQRGYLNAKLSLGLQQCGRTREAEAACREFMQTRFAQQPEGAGEIVPYLLDARSYAPALTQLQLSARRRQGDTINTSYALLLRNLAVAHRGLHQYAQADAMQMRYTILQDSLSRRQADTEAQKWATRFSLSEKEYQLREVQALAERRVLLLSFSLAITLLLAILMVVVTLNLRKTKQRNRIITKQIDELLAQRDELRRSATSPSESPTEQREMTAEYAAFLRMEQTVVEQKLFLRPDFGREDLLTCSPFSKNELVNVLQKYTDAHNVSEYLGRLRVEHSIRLMKENPHLSIDGVLEDSGFSSRSTYYRTFFKLVGMTPAQYLKSLGK